jgi:hypothetical protein
MSKMQRAVEELNSGRSGADKEPHYPDTPRAPIPNVWLTWVRDFLACDYEELVVSDMNKVLEARLGNSE